MFTGPAQAGASASITYLFDIMAQHTACIIAEASKQTGGAAKLTIELTQDAEESWGAEIVQRAAWGAPLAISLPSYLNNEGKISEGEDMMKHSKALAYPLGMNAYAEVLKKWRSDGGLKGLVVDSNY
ncbi:hypothetical protein CIB48_g6430 [Xylaria polymorpha]|nr:hypothetical protein CIB48_g6430 [Xylaria polymorpha]